jgi:hypothetical protein
MYVRFPLSDDFGIVGIVQFERSDEFNPNLEIQRRFEKLAM